MNAFRTQRMFSLTRWLFVVLLLSPLATLPVWSVPPIEVDGYAHIRVVLATAKVVVCQTWVSGGESGSHFAVDARSGGRLWPLPAGTPPKTDLLDTNESYYATLHGVVERRRLSDGKALWQTVLAERVPEHWERPVGARLGLARTKPDYSKHGQAVGINEPALPNRYDARVVCANESLVVLTRSAWLELGCIVVPYFSDWVALDTGTGRLLAGGRGSPIGLCGSTSYALDEQGVYFVTPKQSGPLVLPRLAASPVELDWANPRNWHIHTQDANLGIWPAKRSKSPAFGAVLVRHGDVPLKFLDAPLPDGMSAYWVSGRDCILRSTANTNGSTWFEFLDADARPLGAGAFGIPVARDEQTPRFVSWLKNGAAILASDVAYYAAYPLSGKIIKLSVPIPPFSYSQELEMSLQSQANAVVIASGNTILTKMEKETHETAFTVQVIPLDGKTPRSEFRLPVKIRRIPGQSLPLFY